MPHFYFYLLVGPVRDRSIVHLSPRLSLSQKFFTSPKNVYELIIDRSIIGSGFICLYLRYSNSKAVYSIPFLCLFSSFFFFIINNKLSSNRFLLLLLLLLGREFFLQGFVR